MENLLQLSNNCLSNEIIRYEKEFFKICFSYDPIPLFKKKTLKMIHFISDETSVKAKHDVVLVQKLKHFSETVLRGEISYIYLFGPESAK